MDYRFNCHVLVSCRSPFQSMMVIQSLAKLFCFFSFNCVPFWSALILSILFKRGTEMIILFSVQLNRLLRSYVCCHHCSHPPLPLQRGHEMRVRLWCMSLRWAVQNVAVFLNNSTEKKKTSDECQRISYSQSVCSKPSKAPKTHVFGMRILTG